MSKVKEDKTRVILEVDGKQAINQLGKLEMESKQLALELKSAKKGTQEYIDVSKKLKGVEHDIKAVRSQLGLTGMTMTQLTRFQRDLSKEIKNTATYGTAKYKELNTQLQAVNKTIAQQRAELNGTKGFFSDIKKEMKSFAVLAVGALGITELFSGIQNLIAGSAKLSDAYADVQKTTGLTKTEVEQLNKEFKKMDTRSSREELNALATEAGKLGISGRKDILDFVNGADKINVALGEDLGEDAIKSIGKLNELFGYREIYGYGDSMLKAGSAINELGASSTASEGYIVGFTARLGGAAKQAKISMMDIMGLAATLDSLGQQEETSSTAIGMFLVDMFKDTSTYAKIAGMDMKDFTHLLNTDANEALIKVLEGLNGNNEGFATMVAKLQEVGVEGSRGTQVISALAGNTKMLREQQDIANKSFDLGTSIMEEFNTKNTNFAGNLEKIQKYMAGLFVNTQVMDGLNTFVAKWAEWIRIPISTKLEDERMGLNKLHAQLLTTNIGSEDRIRLMNELKAMAPKMLENLDAETTSNEELSLAVKKVNEQLVNKIILQKEDEKIEARNAEIAEKKIELFEQEDKVREKMIKLAEKYNVEVKAANSLEEQAIQVYNDAMAIEEKQNQNRAGRGRLFDDFAEYSFQLGQMQKQQAAVNGLEEGGNALLEEKNKLLDRLGLSMDKVNQGSQSLGRAGLLTTPGEAPVDGGIVPTVPALPVDQKAIDKAKKDLEKLAEEWQKYQEKIQKITKDYEIAGEGKQEAELLKVKYAHIALEDELVTHLKNKTITRQEFDAQLIVLQDLQRQEESRINSEYADIAAVEKAGAEKKILEATSSEKDLAILKENEHYDTLVKMAQDFGLDTVEIEEARRRAIDAVQKKFNKKEIEEAAAIADAKQMIAQGMSASIGAVIDFIGNKQGELTGFQKALTVAGIAIDTAASLGKVIPLAIEASTGTGPAAPFVFAGYLATMVGTVLGAAAKAKNALSQSNVPEYNSGAGGEGGEKSNTGRSRPPQTKKSFYFGGFTGNEDIGEGDKYGNFAGWVHQNEYVMPASVVQEPFIANLLPAIEAIRQDRANGFSGGSKGVTGAMGSDPETKAILKQILSGIDRFPKEIRGKWVRSELQDIDDEDEYLKKKYSV